MKPALSNEVMSLIGDLICFLDGQKDKSNKRILEDNTPPFYNDDALLAAANKLWDQLFRLRNEFLERYLFSVLPFFANELTSIQISLERET